MEGSHTYISDPESAVLDIPLYNDGGLVIFEVHVKEEDAPQPAAFYNVMLEVENALDVTMTLKNKDGTVVKVLSVSKEFDLSSKGKEGYGNGLHPSVKLFVHSKTPKVI